LPLAIGRQTWRCPFSVRAVANRTSRLVWCPVRRRTASNRT
jgi:hypothetical protein